MLAVVKETHELELAEVGEVKDGDGTFRGIGLSLGERDELFVSLGPS
jgi:hypothetical protein